MPNVWTLTRREFLSALSVVSASAVLGDLYREDVEPAVHHRNLLNLNHMTILGRWDGSTAQSRIDAADALIGQPSGCVRQYLDLTQSYTGGYIQFAFENNRTPIIAVHSWTPQPRHAIPWRDVANGVYDEVILGNAQQFKAMGGRGVPAYIVFHHEPENEEDGKVSGDLPPGETCGSRQDFKDAFDHFRRICRQVLTPADAIFGCTLMAGRYRSGDWTSWVPPVYAFLGIDGYSHGNVNRNGVNTETFDSIFTPAHNAAQTAGKSLVIEEVGVAETPSIPSFKADFITDMRFTAKTWPELLAICYSNLDAKEDYSLDTSSGALNAFKAMAADSAYQGAWT